MTKGVTMQFQIKSISATVDRAVWYEMHSALLIGKQKNRLGSPTFYLTSLFECKQEIMRNGVQCGTSPMSACSRWPTPVCDQRPIYSSSIQPDPDHSEWQWVGGGNRDGCIWQPLRVVHPRLSSVISDPSRWIVFIADNTCYPDEAVRRGNCSGPIRGQLIQRHTNRRANRPIPQHRGFCLWCVRRGNGCLAPPTDEWCSPPGANWVSNVRSIDDKGAAPMSVASSHYICLLSAFVWTHACVYNVS